MKTAFFWITICAYLCGCGDSTSEPQDMELQVPATVTMTAGLGTTNLGAYLCQSLLLSGGIGYSLTGSSASPCIGGEDYLSFSKDTSGEYTIYAGKVLTVANDGPAVRILTTSVGTVTQPSGADLVAQIPENTSVTITTNERDPITIRFNGDDVTVEAFTKK